MSRVAFQYIEVQIKSYILLRSVSEMCLWFCHASGNHKARSMLKLLIIILLLTCVNVVMKFLFRCTASYSANKIESLALKRRKYISLLFHHDIKWLWLNNSLPFLLIFKGSAILMCWWTRADLYFCCICWHNNGWSLTQNWTWYVWKSDIQWMYDW